RARPGRQITGRARFVRAPRTRTCNLRPSCALTNRLRPAARGPSSARWLALCGIGAEALTWSVGAYEGCYHLSRGGAAVSRQHIRFMMPTIDQGKALHRMGRIAEAEAIYRSVLAHDPREFDALHLLGLIRYQQGRAGEAQELLSRAIALRPRSPQA